MESLTGCVVFKNKWFGDERGYFLEAYKRSEFSIPPIKQTNVSKSSKNVIRGLHFQSNRPQGKLVRSLHGSILDVVVDLRAGSKTYGKAESFLLTPEGISVYVPPGYAHGFWALDDECFFHYGCTEEYDKESDGGINPLDPDLCLPWRNNAHIILSEKDKKLPLLKEFKTPFRMEA
jgi:dTDP-4-dehydrorhamnose 3,5-epimerase